MGYDREPPDQPSRETLPNRRGLVRFRLEVDGHRIFVDVGFSPSGKPLQIFCSGLATGSGLAALLNDFACLTSISLQHGVSPATLARSIGRNEEAAGKPATSIFGAVMDLLAKEAVQAPLI